MRVRHIAERRAKGENPFPHKFNVTSSIADYIEKYQSLNAEDVITTETVSIAGLLIYLTIMTIFDRSYIFET